MVIIKRLIALYILGKIYGKLIYKYVFSVILLLSRPHWVALWSNMKPSIYSCNFCGKVTKTESDFRNHSEILHLCLQECSRGSCFTCTNIVQVRLIPLCLSCKWHYNSLAVLKCFFLTRFASGPLLVPIWGNFPNFRYF